ncbi:MAG TPA: ArgE/DapE family deacylase [Bryobacteraceae bacterium]|nr:ArgE/DapE family deacylase [Bryobacteraceae bacterium]
MSAPLLEAVNSYRDAMIELTRQLIAIPTENPPGNGYRETVELLLAHLRGLGFSDTRAEGDCVLSFAGAGDRTLYFSGHYDVVPAQNPSQFEPVVKGTNLFGRGSSDMKSGLAAMIYAAKALLDSGLSLKGRIGLVFVPDEETAGPRGSRYLVERGLLGASGIGMLTPEPTGGVVWNANRGAITLKITVKGKSAHVGRQHEGINAFERMLTVAQALQVLKKEVEGTRQSILMLGGRTEGGVSFNAVPESCYFTVDRRINPEENFGTEKQRLLDVLDQVRAGGIALDVEVLQEGQSCGVSENDPVAQALAHSIQQVTGRAAQFEMCPGLLEIRFYAERGIPAFAYGPGLLTVSHGPNEFVPIDRIVQCAQIYALTAAEILKG